MKLKVADKPVRCIALGHFGGQDVIVTGAGEYGDEEALLRWRRDPNSVSQTKTTRRKGEACTKLR
jgi:hypothetical protein